MPRNRARKASRHFARGGKGQVVLSKRPKKVREEGKRKEGKRGKTREENRRTGKETRGGGDLGPQFRMQSNSPYEVKRGRGQRRTPKMGEKGDGNNGKKPLEGWYWLRIELTAKKGSVLIH